MQIDDLSNPRANEAQFAEQGHTTEDARVLARHLANAANALDRTPSDAEGAAFFVPGRIEVLGKHTDYAGGSSLTCATTRGFCIVAVADASTTLRITRAATGDTERVDLEAPFEPMDSHWSVYPRTVMRRIVRNFGRDDAKPVLRGGSIAFSSSLPQAAGMSSSSAMVVAFFLVLRAMNDMADHPAYKTHLQCREALAAYLGAVESGRPYGPFTEEKGVGTSGGSEDHTAILCAAPGSIRQFQYDPVQCEATLPLPDDIRIVVGVSGVTAEKTGSAQDAYNRASHEAAEAARHWRSATGRDEPHLGAIMRSSMGSLDRFRQAMRTSAADPAPLIRRGEHFHLENQVLIPAATEALRTQDWSTFGALVDRSQRAADELLGNQVPETNWLARSAREHGALAASSFGAGFGGAVWALVSHREADTFRTAWRDAYALQFPKRADDARFFIERPGPPAFAL
jgi:galactokinase